MKNSIIVLGLAASFFMFAGCSANHCCAPCTHGMSAPACAEAAPCHQDLKGEVEK